MAIKAQETRKENDTPQQSVMFLKAIEPEQVKAAAGAAAPRSPPPPPVVPPPAPARRRPPRRLAAAAAAAASPEVAGRGRGAASIDLADAATEYPGDDAVPGGAREVARQAGREGRPAARAAGDGLARRVRRQEPQLRRPRLGRLLPDAHRHLEPGRLRRLPRQARAAGQVVHRPGARRQAQARSPTATRTSARTRRSAASGSPTSSAPPSSSAAATSCGSTRRASCSPERRNQSSPPPVVITGCFFLPAPASAAPWLRRRDLRLLLLRLGLLRLGLRLGVRAGLRLGLVVGSRACGPGP